MANVVSIRFTVNNLKLTPRENCKNNYYGNANCECYNKHHFHQHGRRGVTQFLQRKCIFHEPHSKAARVQLLKLRFVRCNIFRFKRRPVSFSSAFCCDLKITEDQTILSSKGAFRELSRTPVCTLIQVTSNFHGPQPNMAFE